MMNKIVRKLFVGAVAPVLLLSSCGSFDDINTDPNSMSEATSGSFLVPLVYEAATYNWNRYNSWTFPLMQCKVSTSSVSGVGWYIYSNSAGNTPWSTYYTLANNAQAIYNMGVEEDNGNYQAVALTLQSWIFEILTDLFGDVPMSEACQGDDGVYYPKFDTQKEIYAALMENLDEANELYDLTTGLKYNTSGDMLYCESESDTDGMALWKKFTNSLRLRILLRVIDVDGLNAAEKIKAMLDDPETYPIFESNEDNAMVYVTGVAPQEAPLARVSDFTSYIVLSSFFIDQLKEWDDPRLAIFAKTATNDGVTDYYGLDSGYAVLPTGNFSQPNSTNLATAPMDLTVMTYSEVLFIKAELAQRGLINDDASALYEEAVTASITQWGGEVPDGYFENEEAAYDGTLERIMEQKFYALFFCDFQQWFEHNRTGYPEIPVGEGVASGNSMAKRMKYPTTLQSTNPNNYQAAKESMGGDDFYIKLIWQK